MIHPTCSRILLLAFLRKSNSMNVTNLVLVGSVLRPASVFLDHTTLSTDSESVHPSIDDVPWAPCGISLCRLLLFVTVVARNCFRIRAPHFVAKNACCCPHCNSSLNGLRFYCQKSWSKYIPLELQLKLHSLWIFFVLPDFYRNQIKVIEFLVGVSEFLIVLSIREIVFNIVVNKITARKCIDVLAFAGYIE